MEVCALNRCFAGILLGRFFGLLGLNQIENKKVDVKASTIDKFTSNINKFDKNANITFEDLIKYNKNHITNYSRIDEKVKK